MEDVLGPVMPGYGEGKKDEGRAEALAALVRDVVMVLVKTVKATKIYLPNNPIYQKFHEDLGERFDAFFEAEDRLCIQVRPYGLAFMGQQVYENPDKEDNLALMFFRDGIRELSFNKGITREETIGLIEVLRLDSGGRELDDDLVTLLWEREFKHISYTLTEDETEEDADGEASLMFETAPAPGRGQEGLAGYRREDGPELTCVPSMTQVPAAALTAEIPVPYIDYEAIRGTFETADDLSLLKELVDIFYEILLTEKDRELIDTVVESLGRAVEVFVRQGCLAEAGVILKKANDLRRDPRAGVAAPQMDRVVGLACSPEMMVMVGNFIDQGGGKVVDSAAAFLRQLDDRAVPHMVGMLDTLQDRMARKKVCDIIAELCRGRAAPLLPYLEHPNWFVVRNVLMMLGTVSDPDSLAAIGSALGHPETKVRREAVVTLASIKSDQTALFLEKALFDPAKPNRMIAARILAESAPARAFDALTAIVGDKQFEDRLMDEKKEFYVLIGRAGGKRALPFLVERFKKKGVMRRLRGDADRVCAAYGLAATGTPEAVSMLKDGAESGPEAVRAACVYGLKRLGGHAA